MSKKPTLPERIDAVLNGKPMIYAQLAERLWDHSSRAWRRSSNGGPPGCYMALSAALRRGGFFVNHDHGWSAGARRVMPRSKAVRG